MSDVKDVNLFPIRLRVARRILGLSLDELVQIMGRTVTKQSLSLYEKGKRSPKRDVLSALSRALDISEHYLVGDGELLSCASLRSCIDGGTVSEEEWLGLEAEVSFLVEQYMTAEERAGLRGGFSNPLDGSVVSSREEASQAADSLRRTWTCGSGPLPLLLRLLERKGIKVFMCDLPGPVLGFNVIAEGHAPVIVLDNRPEKTTVERLRFTAAHELAHLVLTFPQSLSKNEIESLCDNFAFCLLFPTATLFEELGSKNRTCLALDELIDLKNTYGVSVSSIVYNSHKLGLISDEHYNDWYDNKINKNIREKGWGGYPYQETIGRKLRLDAIIAENNINSKNSNNYEQTQFH